MKKLTLGIVSLVVAVLFTACASSSNPEMKNVKYMDDAQINALFNDKTIEGVTKRGARPFKLFFKSDGTVTGMVGDENTSGTWVTKNGTKCMKTSGKTYCRKHFEKDGKYYTVNENGDVTSTFTSK